MHHPFSHHATTVALNDSYEAMVVSRHLLVNFLLREQLKQFYLMYLETGSQHPSNDQSYTLVCHQSSSTISLLPILLTKKTPSRRHYITQQCIGGVATARVCAQPAKQACLQDDFPKCLPFLSSDAVMVLGDSLKRRANNCGFPICTQWDLINFYYKACNE